MDTQFFSVKQLADLAQISKDTVLRAVQRGELVAELEPGTTGIQYHIATHAAHDWLERRMRRTPSKPNHDNDSAEATQAPQETHAPHATQAPHEWTKRRMRRTPSKPNHVNISAEATQAPQETHAPHILSIDATQAAHDWMKRRMSNKPNHDNDSVEATQAPQETHAPHAALETGEAEIFTVCNAPSSVPMEVHLQALRLVERAQMQLELVRHELNSSQRILTEQAESLMEANALKAQLNAIETEHTLRSSLWESEKLRLTDQLQAANQKVSWLESRIPRWLRRLCGA